MAVEVDVQPPLSEPELPAVTEENQPEFLTDNLIETPPASPPPEVVAAPVVEEIAPIEEVVPVVVSKEDGKDNEWHELLPKLALSGMSKQLAEHCLLEQLADDKLVLLLESSGVTLKTRLTEEALQEALSGHFGRPLTVEYNAVEVIAETPAQRRVRHGEELQQKAEQSIENDLFVQQLTRDYGGMVLAGSIRPNKASE